MQRLTTPDTMGNGFGAELQLEARRLPLRRLAPPAPGEAHLWLLDLARLGSPLQPDEPIDAARISAVQRRTLRRFYLRLLLGDYLGLPGKDVHVLRSGRGKPVLDPSHHDSPLDFSVAASGAYCLMGITSGAVIGVDLEPRGRRAGKPLALARRYFSAAEYEALAALSEGTDGKDGREIDEAFLHTWACKEAVVKAGGTGIANALCRFTVEVRPGQPTAVLAMDEDEADAWQLRSFSLPHGLVGAVTVRFPTLTLAGFRLEPPA
jgi:4'-phosphopantetheinyl transferase